MLFLKFPNNNTNPLEEIEDTHKKHLPPKEMKCSTGASPHDNSRSFNKADV